jgi:peptide/nickel transport system substrate-binding protein
MSRQMLGRSAAVLVVWALLATACAPRESASQRSPGAGQPVAQGAPQAPAQAPANRVDLGQAKQGGTLNVALQKDIALMNPLVQTASTDHAVRDLMYESLLAEDDSGNLQPKLAERWEIAPDGKVYTFHLRRGVKFHNGQEMTAEDLKFAIDYSMDPKNAAYGYTMLENVDRAEAVDRNTLRIHLKTASAAFLPIVSTIQSFSAIPKDSVQEGVDKPTAFPPGTGPFRFVEWQPKQRLTLARFDDYWGHKAFVDQIVIKPIAEPSVRITALRAGDVDLIDRTPYEWVREIMDGKLRGIGYAEAEEAGFRTLKINVADPPLNNLKLRQAIAHALDKKELLEAAYYGFGRPIDQMYPQDHVWYVAGLPWPTYDLDKARALLREAGYNGQEIMVLGEQGAVHESEITMLQAQLKKVGINLKLEFNDWATYRERQRKGEFGLLTYGGSTDADPAVTYSGELMCEPDLRRRMSNMSGYCDKQMDAMMEQMLTELDTAKRKALLQQIVTKMAQEIPEIPIGFVPRYYTFRDQVKNFTTDGEGRLMHYGGGLNYTWLDR